MESASCNYKRIPIQVSKSVNVTKTNTLHQFDAVGIIGLRSPVGKVPIVFYLKETHTSGRRGILYYDDRDTVCWMYPEDKHAEWCKQPYRMKYDGLEHWDNGLESGLKRNHGIFELWVSVFRKWYNGHVMYRPKLKLQGCGRRAGGYPTESNIVTVEEKPAHKTITVPKKMNIKHGCNCRKGV